MFLVADEANAFLSLGMDAGKAYVVERENLELLEHEWVLDHFERRAMKLLKSMERSGQ